MPPRQQQHIRQRHKHEQLHRSKKTKSPDQEQSNLVGAQTMNMEAGRNHAGK